MREQISLSDNEVKPWKSAALAMVFLGPLFFLVYGACNWITSHRTDVASFYWEWEKSVPVIPWMILPYMSIDLFFAISVFLCRSKQELYTHVKRIVAAILISAAGFLLFPLKFGFDRPEVDGFYGIIFNSLFAFDKPFNQAPSLHISLLIILWVLYARYTKGLWKLFTHVWFFLIGLSTLVTYQHHFIDILTGIIPAVVCFYMFPEKSKLETEINYLPSNVSYRIAAYYLVGVAICIALAYITFPIGLVFLWPMVSLGIVAGAYLKLGATIFRKKNGRLSLSSRILLAPYLVGSYLSYLCYTRSELPYQEIIPGIIAGRRLNKNEAKEIMKEGRIAVLDLTGEFSEFSFLVQNNYMNLPILDLTHPSLEHLNLAIRFIEEHHKLGKVFIHCAIGRSRSMAIVVAYLLSSGHASSITDAIQVAKKSKPNLVLNSGHIAAIEGWYKTLPVEENALLKASL